MKQLNYNTEKAKSFIRRYWNTNDTSLRDCYARYSNEKSVAEQYCRDLMTREGGYAFRIISYNTFGFSCGWQVKDAIRIETPTNSYIIPGVIQPF